MRLSSFLRQNANWLTAGGMLTFLSSFGQTFFISLFAAEIQSEFELTHGTWGATYALGTAISAMVMIWAGTLTDHFRVRGLGVITLVGLAAACLLMAVNHSAWILVFVIFALRLTGQGMLSHISVVAMARWFVAARGRALSIAALGFSAGQALLPLVFVGLMGVFDWRLLWILCAGVAMLGVPALYKLLSQERTPQSMAHESASFGMKGQHWTRLQTIRHPLFWFMVPALLGPSAFITATFFHQVHLTEIKDITLLSLVALFPIYTLLTIAAMLTSGWLLDHFGTARLIPFYQIPMVISFGCFAGFSGMPSIILGFGFMAITAGANSTLPSAFWAEFYGTRFIGSIKSIAAAIMVLGSAIGPLITGFLIDYSVHLEQQFIGMAFYFALSSILMMFGVRRYAALI